MRLKTVGHHDAEVLFDVNNNVSVLNIWVDSRGFYSRIDTTFYMVKTNDKVLYRCIKADINGKQQVVADWYVIPDVQISPIESETVLTGAYLTWIGLESYDKMLTDQFPKDFWSVKPEVFRHSLSFKKDNFVGIYTVGP